MIKVLFVWAGNLIFTLLLTIAAFLLITMGFLGWQFNTVIGGSMDPTLKAGGIIISQAVEPEDIAIGDIVNYYSPAHDALIVHRVVERHDGEQTYFVTQGDANGVPDPYLVPAQNVLGKVHFHVPAAGHVSQTIKSPMGPLLLMMVPGLLIIGKSIGNIRTEMANLWGSRRLTPPADGEAAPGSWETGLRKQDWAHPAA